MSLYKCTADSLYILRSAVTCVKSTFCSIPFFFGLEMFVTLSYFMQHVASTWQQPLVLRCRILDPEHVCQSIFWHLL